VANITATSTDPKKAAAAANAYAVAVIADRKAYQQRQIRQAEQLVDHQLGRAVQGSTVWLSLTDRAQELRIMEATVTGDFRVVAPASVPSVPISPRPLRAAVLGAMAGVFVAIALALALEQLNTRIRDYRETSEILKLPVIGRIPVVPKKYASEDHPVMVVDHPESRVSEAFRMLRGNLDFVCLDQGPHVVMVTSCWQGEGKSMSVANLAAALALAGKKCVLVDGDLRRPQQHKYFDIANEKGLSTVLSGLTPIHEALQAVDLEVASTGSNGGPPAKGGADSSGILQVLTSGPEPPNPGEMTASKRFAELMAELKRDNEYVLIDSPAIMAVGDASALVQGVDGVVVLVDISTTRKPALREVYEMLAPMPCDKLGIICAREKMRPSQPYRYSYYKSGQTYRGSQAARG
jgi:receptor protein-tyrosine kinase